MKLNRWTTVLTAISIIAWSAAVCAQPAGDKPKINVGDQWEFVRTTQPSGKADAWSRTVVETPAEDRLRVKLESGTIADYNGGMDWMQDGRTEFLRPLAIYPLTVGKAWSIDRRFPNPSTAENGGAKVVAVEKITVPAGTYECFRVDADAWTTSKANYSAHRIWSRWYCPDVKWIAKEVLETRTQTRDNPAGSGTTIETSELVRFTPGK